MNIASEKQASDIVLLDIREICSFADYFVVCSAETERQIKAVCEDIDKGIQDNGGTLLHQEGTPDSGWVILDFGDMIVHIFAPRERNYYQLEKVWEKATTLLRIQ